MAKSDYINPNDDAFVAQLETFKNAIGGYATLLGLSPAQITAQAADADYFGYVVSVQNLMRNAALQWTSWRDLQRNGGTPPPSGAPTAPVFPPSVPAVAPGIEPRFRALAKQIKGHTGYNEAIGAALGIEGSSQVGPDLTTVQPDIEVVTTGGQVAVKWGWGGNGAFLDMCELQVDRADGKGFVMLCFDTTPNYTDSTPFPATPAKWAYQAIYHVGDHRVGQWSKPVSVTVGG